MSRFDLPAEIEALAQSDEAIVVVQDEGAVVLMTPAAEKLLGWKAEDVVGEFVEMLLPEDRRRGHQAYRRGFLAEPSERDMDPGLHPHARRPDATLVPIRVHLVPHPVDGDLYVEAHIREREEDAADAASTDS